MNQLQFDKGIMKLSAYDPLSNQYETRILTLPELPLLESLEHIFNNNNNENINLRSTKSCSNKRSVSHYVDTSLIESVVTMAPRRCQSIPNLTNHTRETNSNKKIRKIQSKRSLSSAFQAFTGFIQKANKKILPPQPVAFRFSSDSNISSLDLCQPSFPPRETIVLSKNCENWWNQSPPISSF